MVRLIVIFLFFVLGFASCNKVQKNEKTYIYIDGRDTSKLRLVTYENTFYGDLVHTKGGIPTIVGKINGNIKGDTLIGDNYYKPYRWKENKRVPIVLLKQGDNYIEGNGKMQQVLGILTYMETSINFDNPKRVYAPIGINE